MIRIFVLACSLLLTGCNVVNCIINNHPEFSKNTVNNATLNQVYEDSITASISNSFEDRQYRYSFEFEGELPEGVSYSTSGRQFMLAGTPTELGEFPFKLTVTATKLTAFSSENEPEDLCSDTESREMVLLVVQGG